MVSWRSDRAGQGLIPKLFWPGTLDCKTAFGRSLLIAVIEWPGAGTRRGLRQKSLALPRRSQQWPRRLHVGAIQDHQAWVHPPGLMIVDAPITTSDLAQSVARLRHRGDDILLESRWLSTSRWWYSYQFAVGPISSQIQRGTAPTWRASYLVNHMSGIRPRAAQCGEGPKVRDRPEAAT